MQNFVQWGDTITVTAPAAGTIGGTPLQVGRFVGIPVDTVASGVQVSMTIKGVFTCNKAAVAISEGDPLYWDATAGNFTNVYAPGKLRAGTAVTTQLAGDATVQIKLAGQAQESDKFVSATETGTGVQQSIPHGLGVIPSQVMLALVGGPAAYTQPSLTQSLAADATNVYITATTGWEYQVFAWA